MKKANVASLPPMVGGEIHYGRVQAKHWGAILDSARTLGAEVIGMYVMWDLHEVREGVFDFALLQAFLAEIRARRLRVLARPGPFFYAEWRNLGIPDHAVPFGKHHPEFRRKAAAWIDAVMEVLRPHLGSLIVAVQADNEIDPMPYIYGEDQGFAAWLERRYGTPAAMNAAWNTNYAAFAEAIPALAPIGPLRDDPRLRDGCRYRYDLATDYARWVVEAFRANGCTVPILLNTWPGVDAQHWRDLASIADFYGIDPYPSNECRTDLRYFRERLRLLRCVTDFPYIAEFGAGVWHGAPPEYSPDHYRLTAMTALQSGVRGWNWYMLANRDNWTGAPINERGVIHPELGDAFREASAAFRELRDAPPPQVSFGVTWSWHWHQVAQIEKRPADDPLFETLQEMGVEYDFVDVDEPIGGSAPPLLFVAGELADASHLWRYAEAGGHVVAFQRLPAGCATPDGTSHPGAENLKVVLPGSTEAFIANGPVFDHRSPPGSPVVATQLAWRTDADMERLMHVAVGRRYVTGYFERRGQGSLLVLGCRPNRDAILAVHRFHRMTIPALSLTAGVQVSRRGTALIVTNPGAPVTAKIEVDHRVIHVDVPRCSGVIHEL